MKYLGIKVLTKNSLSETKSYFDLIFFSLEFRTYKMSKRDPINKYLPRQVPQIKYKVTSDQLESLLGN